MKSIYNYKACGLAIKDVDKKSNVVALYANAFNNVDAQKEVVKKGAFSETIRKWGPEGKNRIWHLMFHDSMRLVGKPQLIKEDEIGLYVESKIAGTDAGRELLVLYEEGFMNEHSIGYDVVKDYYDSEANVRELLEIKLYEYSSVPWGSNEQTPFMGFPAKTKSIQDLCKEFKSVERVLRREITDETAVQFEIYLKQLQQALIDSLTLSEDGGGLPEGDSEKPENLDRCVRHLVDQGYTEQEAWAICNATLRSSITPELIGDIDRILSGKERDTERIIDYIKQSFIYQGR